MDESVRYENLRSLGQLRLQLWSQTTADLLRNGNLAGLFWKLQTGSHEEASRLKLIQEEFYALTHQEVRLKMIGSPQSVGAVSASLRAELVLHNGQFEVPLKYAGSGVGRMLWILAGLAALPSESLVLLDEPDLALHPTWQLALSQKFDVLSQSSTQDVQLLMTVHSPSLLPELDGRIRRLALSSHPFGSPHTVAYPVPVKPRANATPAEGVSPPISSKGESQPEENGEKTKTTPGVVMRYKARAHEYRECLFASVVVLVEGPNDAAVFPIWFQQWVRNRYSFIIPRDPIANFLGIRFQPSEGVGNIPPLFRFFQGYGLTTIAIPDADILSNSKDRDRFQRRGLLPNWVPGIPDHPGANKEILPNPSPPPEDSPVFLLGATASDSLEKLSIFSGAKSAEDYADLASSNPWIPWIEFQKRENAAWADRFCRGLTQCFEYIWKCSEGDARAKKFGLSAPAKR